MYSYIFSKNLQKIGFILGLLLLSIQLPTTASTSLISQNINESLNTEIAPLGTPDSFVSPSSTTRLVLKLNENRLYVYQNEVVQTSYTVAIGRAGWETPTGTFEVMQMQRNPIWKHPWTGELVKPGPENPLGAGWIGFWSDGNHVIGFHGTNQEDSIGKAVSHGCVRMRNQDISALLNQVKIGTPVIVEP